MERTSQRTVPVMLFVVAIALVGARAVSHLAKPAAPEGVQWISLDELQGRRPDQPILLLFTADWSAAARALETEVSRSRDLAGTINRRFIPVRIVDRRREDGRNAPQVEALVQRFSVREFPTIVISDGSGNELARMEGPHEKEELEQILRRYR